MKWYIETGRRKNCTGILIADCWEKFDLLIQLV